MLRNFPNTVSGQVMFAGDMEAKAIGEFLKWKETVLSKTEVTDAVVPPATIQTEYVKTCLIIC